MKILKAALLFVMTIFFIASCSPIPVESVETHKPTNYEEIGSPSISIPTASPSVTPIPSKTLITPTITITPTPDYSLIKLVGAFVVQNNYGYFTQVILDLGNLKGEFYGKVGTELFNCEFRKDITSQIDCIGIPVIKDRWIKFSLFIPTNVEPIFTTSFLIPGAIPTPEGMVCEIEGLWTDVIRARGYFAEPGCYAVTCWIDGKYYGGVQDSCKEYWPWIPPGLFPTPLPTP